MDLPGQRRGGEKTVFRRRKKKGDKNSLAGHYPFARPGEETVAGKVRRWVIPLCG